MYSQKDKQSRGARFEQEFRASCNEFPCWVRKMLTGFQGTPFDYLVLTGKKNWGIELKVVKSPRLAYSTIRDNQRRGLTYFSKVVPQNKSALIVNWRDIPNKTNKCYFVPWDEEKNNVCSGRRGSIKLEKYPEIPRLKLENGSYGWDIRRELT